MSRTRKVLLGAIFIVVAAIAAWALAPANAPAGQPPLATIDAASLETLRADFNRFSDHVRVVVLLSPT